MSDPTAGERTAKDRLVRAWLDADTMCPRALNDNHFESCCVECLELLADVALRAVAASPPAGAGKETP